VIAEQRARLAATRRLFIGGKDFAAWHQDLGIFYYFLA